MYNSETSLEGPLRMLKISGLLIPGVFQKRFGILIYVKVISQRRVELF
jgi:hypothetical protein